ncbi:unnamed protein product [Spirodela intermedia]|uniref:Dof-type domain-containing protein n=1 Tax=Spirodela intermedia TaxID=51605 RepID=A0A7I8J4N7_SPIIN|nr:unnamed protein product [Spirodela intermedia]CAA6665196.1 unnamed protein product [Spirodela intermedia]
MRTSFRIPASLGSCRGIVGIGIGREERAAISFLSRQEPLRRGRKEPEAREAGEDPPCPRCNSMATKFCYYNNYNLNQPRHFCKNCQRYWTAGGTMRNVPVGAGRRKNKHSAAYCRHITVVKAPLSPEEHAPVFPAEEKSNSAGGEGWGENAPCFSGIHGLTPFQSTPWRPTGASPGCRRLLRRAWGRSIRDRARPNQRGASGSPRL